MTIKKAILITIFLSAILFFLQLFDLSKTLFYDVGLKYIYYIESSFIILIYFIIIFYANNFKIKNITKNLFIYHSDIRIVVKIPFLIFFLILFLYSFKALINAFFIGSLDKFLTEDSFKLLFYGQALYAFFLFPFVEELLFRKTILQGLFKLYSNKKSILISSFLFAVVHFFANANVSLVDVFIVGVIFGYVYLHYGFLYSFILHILINFLMFFLTPIVSYYLLSINQQRVPYLLYTIIVISFLGISFLYYKEKVRLNG